MARRGPIARAVIARIAKDRRIPVGAAAHRYDCMSIERKQRLCTAEERRRQETVEASSLPNVRRLKTLQTKQHGLITVVVPH